MVDGVLVCVCLCDFLVEVSVYWLIYEDGIIEVLVFEDCCVWYVGVGEWWGSGDVNFCSIGIELVNIGVCFFFEL